MAGRAAIRQSGLEMVARANGRCAIHGGGVCRCCAPVVGDCSAMIAANRIRIAFTTTPCPAVSTNYAVHCIVSPDPCLREYDETGSENWSPSDHSGVYTLFATFLGSGQFERTFSIGGTFYTGVISGNTTGPGCHPNCTSVPCESLTRTYTDVYDTLRIRVGCSGMGFIGGEATIGFRRYTSGVPGFTTGGNRIWAGQNAGGGSLILPATLLPTEPCPSSTPYTAGVGCTAQGTYLSGGGIRQHASSWGTGTVTILP